MHPARLVCVVLLSLWIAPVQAAEPPAVRELRVQQVGDVTYFHVRFDLPKDVEVPRVQGNFFWNEETRRQFFRLPRLVAQDDVTQAVNPRFMLAEFVGGRPFDQPVKPDEPLLGAKPVATVPVEGLEFVGKIRGKGEAKFVLLYVPENRREEGRKRDVLRKVFEPRGLDAIPQQLAKQYQWVEVPVVLKLDTAPKVAVPVEASKRKPDQAMSRDDLEGLWASAQVQHFAVQEFVATEFSFSGFARMATARKYGVPDALEMRERFGGRSGRGPGILDHERLYETTTGATAIAESLQLQRMLAHKVPDQQARTMDIAKVQGIDIAEHPWAKMMAGQKPAPEPLAKLVPHDNYYVHFKNIRKFIEFGELFDQWGTNLIRAYEVNSRDYRLKERYEKQLCIKSTWMGKTLGPALVKSLAITGNDGYLREGSDVTVLFHVVNAKVFLAGVDQFIQDARKEFGGTLKEGEANYQGVTIESYVTPLREVSLHRSTFGEFVIYSNSPVAVRRVIDTHQGRLKALADSLDFQYMRTVFRLDDPAEDGFAFLSDPFIRQLVGPASKIKEKRRLEALTSMYMVTNGALFTAWETGKLPADHQSLMAAAHLKPEEIYAPEGKGVVWERRSVSSPVAVSDAYNTIHFATPLVELPIDKITPNEQMEYDQFRQQYLRLWRRFFDPIGMRFALTDKQVKIDTYILPLIQSSGYAELRDRTGNGTTALDPAGFSPKTLMQMTSHISPNAPERRELAQLLSNLSSKIKGLDWLGDWFWIRLDDSAVYAKLAERWLRQEIDPDLRNDSWMDEVSLFFQIPLSVGVSIKNPLVFAGVLTAFRSYVLSSAPDIVTWEPLEKPHKDVTIVRIQAKPQAMNQFGVPRGPLPAIYYATVAGGWYASLSQDALHEIIDRVLTTPGADATRLAKTVDINNSVYLAPGAAEKTAELLRFYLEWEAHKRALANAPILHTLHRCGVSGDEAAYRYLGFVPVSPDGAAYTYDKKTDDIVNQRHGSPRRPQLHAGIEPNSPLSQVLARFRTLRADLRFREDGVHTVVTVERQAGGK